MKIEVELEVHKFLVELGGLFEDVGVQTHKDGTRMYCLVHIFFTGCPNCIPIVFPTFHEDVYQIHDVCIQWKQGTVEGVLRDNGGEDGLHHQHRGDKSLKAIDQGCCFRKITDDGITSVDIGESEEVRRIAGDGRGWVFVEPV